MRGPVADCFWSCRVALSGVHRSTVRARPDAHHSITTSPPPGAAPVPASCRHGHDLAVDEAQLTAGVRHVDAGVRPAPGTRYPGRRGGAFRPVGRDGPAGVRARFAVGADGARSSVARERRTPDLPLRPRPLLRPRTPGPGGRRRAARPRRGRGVRRPPPHGACAGPWNGSAPRPPGRPAWTGPGRWSGAGPDVRRRGAAPHRLCRRAPRGRRGGRGLAPHRRGPGPVPAPAGAGRLRLRRRAPAGATGPVDPLRRSRPARALPGTARPAQEPGAHPDAGAAATAASALPRTPFGRAAAGRVLFGDRSFPAPSPTGHRTVSRSSSGAGTRPGWRASTRTRP